MTQGTSDRRQGVRFEVVGELWGSLATTMSVRVRNVSGGGMLIESPRPLPAGVTYQVRVVTGHEVMVVPARVCHTRAGGGEDRVPYLVGLAFFDVPAAAARWFAGLTDSGPMAGTAAAYPE